MDGILGLTEQAWGDWLGTGPPMTSRMEQSALRPLYTLLLVIAGGLLLASSICTVLAWRRPRTGRRQWAWRRPRRPGAVGWAVRASTVAAALSAAGIWALLPLRGELASITPVRVTLVTSALGLFCVVVVITALTRRAISLDALIAATGIEHGLPVSTQDEGFATMASAHSALVVVPGLTRTNG